MDEKIGLTSDMIIDSIGRHLSNLATNYNRSNYSGAQMYYDRIMDMLVTLSAFKFADIEDIMDVKSYVDSVLDLNDYKLETNDYQFVDNYGFMCVNPVKAFYHY